LPPLLKFQERGQAPLPDLFYFHAQLSMYEIVEGQMHELRRVSYAPGT